MALDRPGLKALAMQLKLVCIGLVALARWRPTAFLEFTPSGVREYPLRDRPAPPSATAQ
jgi:hypothetical protein